MKKTIFLAVFSILLLSVSAYAQDEERFSSGRLDNYAVQLKRSTVDLVDRTSDRLNSNTTATRAEIEEAFLASQLDASAGLFQEMTRGNRRAVELRDASALIGDLTRRAPSYGSNSYLWRDVQTALSNINRELGVSGSGGTPSQPVDNRPIIGRLYWRGNVDDKVQLVIRGGNVEHRTLSGRSYPDGTFSFTSELPYRKVDVEADKKKGRGNVRVVQQPVKANDFTTVIEISDTDGGAREYQLEIYWR
jgi:hypothetical protein